MKLPITLQLGEVDCEATVFDDALQFVCVSRPGEPDSYLFPAHLVSLMGRAEYDRWAQGIVDDAGTLLENERHERNGLIRMGAA